MSASPTFAILEPPAKQVADSPELLATIISHLAPSDQARCACVSKGVLGVVVKVLYRNVNETVFQHLYAAYTPPARLELYLGNVKTLFSPYSAAHDLQRTADRYPALSDIRMHPVLERDRTTGYVWAIDRDRQKFLLRAISIYHPRTMHNQLKNLSANKGYSMESSLKEVTMSGRDGGGGEGDQVAREREWRFTLQNELERAEPVLKGLERLTINSARKMDPPLDNLLEATPKLKHLRITFAEPNISLTCLPSRIKLQTLLPHLRSLELFLPFNDSWTGNRDSMWKSLPTRIVGIQHVIMPFQCLIAALFRDETPSSKWFVLPEKGKIIPLQPTVRTVEFHVSDQQYPTPQLTALRIALFLVTNFSADAVITFINASDGCAFQRGTVLYWWTQEILTTRQQLLARARGERAGWKMLEKGEVGMSGDTESDEEEEDEDEEEEGEGGVEQAGPGVAASV